MRATRLGVRDLEGVFQVARRKRLLRLAGVVVGTAALLALPAGLRADDPGQAAAQQGRAVRLSFVQGHVQVSQGGQMLADPAVVNIPLFEGTQIATLNDGQAEVQFEDGSIARISPNSSITLSVLRGEGAAAQTEITANGGLGYFEIQAGGAASTRLRFADAVVAVNGFTVLRVDMDNPPGDLAVFTGDAHVERGTAMMLDMHAGESVALSSIDASRYDLAETIQPDSWDTWNTDRDQALQAEYGNQTPATQGLPDPENPAWADLDANGQWYDVPGQGQVWSPNDASQADWDPYGNGYWMAGGDGGYMWVSGYPWGYMPFQCGTWNYFDAFGWGWAPGMCRPWWFGGGWFGNVGFAPGGYRHPRPPHPIPGRPHGPGQPVPVGGRRMPHPLIPVNRKLSGAGGTLPPRSRDTVVSIGGHTVQPIRPGTRPVYGRTSSGFANRGTAPTVPAGAPGARTPGNPGYRPSAPHPGGFRPAPAPPSHPSGGGGSSFHPSAPSGGGGGGSHGGGGGGHR